MSVPTIVCQLCHTEQPNAWDCAACGHPLHERPALRVAATALPELDPGRAPDAGNVAIEQVPGLETTSLRLEPAADAGMLEGLETTAVAAAGDVPTGLVPGIETTALPAVPDPIPPRAVACRSCGTPWQEGAGLFCLRCGMRVSIPRPVRASAGPAPGAVTCPGCGTPGQHAGDPCRACGQRVLAPR